MTWPFARIAEQEFGLAGGVTPLPGERTLNAAIDTTGGRFVLKLHPPAERAEVELEIAALDHVATCGIAVPGVVRATDGRTVVEVETPAGPRLARMLTWLPGETWAAGRPHPGHDLAALGGAVAVLDAALAGFEHPAALRALRWNLVRAADQRALLPHVPDVPLRARVAAILDRFAADLAGPLAALPQQPIHNDANDANVLLGSGGGIGLIDFGDLCTAPRICGLAVACTYAMFGADGDPVRTITPLVAGYHQVAPLQPAELALLFDLIRTRLAVSVVMAGWQHAADPDNDYLLVSQTDAVATLDLLDAAGPALAHYRLREACGYEPVPHARAVRRLLSTMSAHPVLDPAPARTARLTFDWSAGSSTAGLSPQDLFAELAAAGATLGVGRYLEDRAVYAGELFDAGEPGGERRTVHLGVDLFVPAGSPVHAPLDGVIVAFADNPAPLDYGPVVILRHDVPDGGAAFFTLYGHLARTGLAGWQPGRRVAAGEVIGTVGEQHENGGWPPHLHLQLLTDLLGLGVDVPGVASRGELGLWESVSPDPNLLLALPEGTRAIHAPTDPAPGAHEIERRRAASMSPALSLSYREPLHIVRGEGAHLYDTDGTGWLDLVNNVAHVGHCHPRVVAAAAGQQAVLNTNTRYLHSAVVEYARRLTATLPDPLSVCFFVNSGSEANDLALRLAYAHTRSREVLVLDHAYHGNLTSLVDVSPYKFDGPGGAGRPPHTHVVPLPDVYRGAHPDAAGYLNDVDGLLERIAAAGDVPAALLAESIPGTAGQVVLADGFLAGAYERVRAAGGICIADEVQTGFGRVGSHFWSFEQHGVVPDIVTMGKPIGNGHPIGAVVVTPQVARSFLTGMEYFNTFGGNPVSARVGLAVLDVIADERLQQHAATVGGRLRAGLRGLADRHPLVGDVRGSGLFLGVELVADRADRAARRPDGAAASAVVEQVKRLGVLLSSDGPDHNVLKIKPPMVLRADDADRVVAALDQALATVAAGRDDAVGTSGHRAGH